MELFSIQELGWLRNRCTSYRVCWWRKKGEGLLYLGWGRVTRGRSFVDREGVVPGTGGEGWEKSATFMVNVNGQLIVYGLMLQCIGIVADSRI